VQNCEADVQSSKVWAHSTYGVLCGSGATVNASSTSIYKYGVRTAKSSRHISEC
jgi:hypothetical protein